MSNTTINKIKDILAEELDLNLELENIDENASLFEEGLNVDSLGIVELIALLEEKFDIQFEEEDLSPEYFSNLKSLGDLVEKKQTA